MTKILTLLMGVVVMMAVGVAQKTEVSHGSGSTVVSNQPTITKQSSSHSPPTHPPPPPPTKGHVTTLGHSSHSFHDKTLGRSSITEHQHQQHHSTQQTNHHKKKKKHHHHQKKHPNSTGEDPICERIKDADPKTGLHVMLVGVTHEGLVLITDDRHVYRVPRKSLHASYPKLFLDAEPLPMEQVWPELANSKKFRTIEGKLINTFVIINKQGATLAFVSVLGNGVNFNLQSMNVTKGWKEVDFNGTTIASTGHVGKLYSFTKHVTSVATVKVHGHKLTRTDRYKFLCQDNQHIYSTSNASNCEQMPLSIEFAYAFGKNFFIFTPSNVIYFPEKVLKTEDKMFKYHKVQYHDFIICRNETDLDSGKNSVTVLIAVVAVVVVVGVVGISILFMYQKQFMNFVGLDDSTTSSAKKTKSLTKKQQPPPQQLQQSQPSKKLLSGGASGTNKVKKISSGKMAAAKSSKKLLPTSRGASNPRVKKSKSKVGANQSGVIEAPSRTEPKRKQSSKVGSKVSKSRSTNARKKSSKNMKKKSKADIDSKVDQNQP